MSRIYKILARSEWKAAQATGAFTGSAVDLKDGYIHFSTAAQAGETARLHFHGKPDLVILDIEAEVLGAALKWEPSRGGQLFPHLYGSLPVEAVTRVIDLPLGADGAPLVLLSPGELA